MSNSTHRSRPGYVETILQRVTDYGTTRVQQAIAPTADEQERCRLLAVEIFGDIAVIATARRVPDPTLDERLRVAYNPDLDYGPNPGPSDAPCLTVVGTGPTCDNCGGPASGVHSDHTRTEDAAYAAADLAANLTEPAVSDVAEICRTLGAPSGPTDVAIREIPTAYPIHYAASGAIRAFAVEGHTPLVTYNFEARTWSAEPAPAAPVAVSPERVVKILARLNREEPRHQSDRDEEIRCLREFKSVVSVAACDEILAFKLVDDTVIACTYLGSPWSAVPR